MSSSPSLDFFAGVLSAFDLGDILSSQETSLQPKGLEWDLQQLSKDQAALAEDYSKATQRIMRTLWEGNLWKL